MFHDDSFSIWADASGAVYSRAQWSDAIRLAWTLRSILPDQDTMPKGGFGNLIALPLQKASRDLGNSVFLDEQLTPSRSMGVSVVCPANKAGCCRRTGDEAERKGDLVCVRISVTEDDETLDPFAKYVEITRANLVYVAKNGLPAAMLNRLLRIVAFQNTDLYKAQCMRHSTYDKPRVIGCAMICRNTSDCRGVCWQMLSSGFSITQCRRQSEMNDSGAPIGAEFRGILREHQAEAAQAVIVHDDAPTAFGETALAAWLIAQRNVPTSSSCSGRGIAYKKALQRRRFFDHRKSIFTDRLITTSSGRRL